MEDILLNSAFDLQYNANGEIIRGESSLQHQLLLLTCVKGDFKENPTVCVGAEGFLKENDPGSLLMEIKKEFERDGMKVNTVQLLGNDLKIDAVYGS
jgi:hypothetical protein